MRLTLGTLRSPPGVAPETRTADGGEFSIGRGPDNDWVLPDPERHLSKRHCVLAFRADCWQVADLSANGTFVNGEADALGPGVPRRLRHGDRLRLGGFEIELQMAPDEVRPDPFALDPFAPQPSFRPESGPGSDQNDPLRSQGWGAGLPADFDPLAPDAEEDGVRGPVQSDHSPSTSDAFWPAPVHSNRLPDDWAEESRPARDAPASSARLARDAPGSPAGPAASPPRPAPSLPVRPAPAPVSDKAGLLAAFLRGAGMADVAVADPAATMEQIGLVMRELVAGLRRALIARAAVKGEFRIEQTMISARGNNPLKFAADDDDALASLVGGARRTTMPPPAAVAEALRDLRLHELATMSAMQAAVRALIASLDPAAIRQAAEAGGLNLPLQRKARAWDAYAALHARVSRSLADDFDSVFGKNFARAYEQAEAEIAGRRDDL